MNIEHIIYTSIVFVLISAFVYFALTLRSYFRMLEMRYQKEIEEFKYKEQKIKQETAIANLELAQTYERLSNVDKEDKQNLQDQAQSFGKAVTSIFKEINEED